MNACVANVRGDRAKAEHRGWLRSHRVQLRWSGSDGYGGRGCLLFFFQAEDGIRDVAVTGVQTCALPICLGSMFNPPAVWRLMRRRSQLPSGSSLLFLPEIFFARRRSADKTWRDDCSRKCPIPIRAAPDVRGD